MERFRLRVRHEPKRGHIWELHLFPEHPHRPPREADGRILGSSATPDAILWLRQIAGPFLFRAEAPSAIAAEAFGPRAEPHWLKPEHGMRLALAFSAARWLTTGQQRRMFREGIEQLPSEVVLYWFTLCFYGYRQSAGRAALRTLLTHEERMEKDEEDTVIQRRRRQRKEEPTLSSMAEGDLFAASQQRTSSNTASGQPPVSMESVTAQGSTDVNQGRQTSRTGMSRRSGTRRRKKGQEEVQ